MFAISLFPPIIWTNLKFLYPRIYALYMLNVWLKLACGTSNYGRIISFIYIRYFIIIYPCKRTWPFDHLHKLESPSPKDNLCQQIKVKIGLRLFEKIFKFCQHNITISLLFSSGKDLNKPESSSLNCECFVPSWTWPCSWDWKTRWRKVKKNYRQTTEYKRSEKLH